MLKTFTQRSSREQTRERILAKTDELVRYYGFAKTTVADIAAALKMSPANIYKFFPSKDALIQAVAELKVAEVKRSLEDVISSSPGALARLEGLALTIFRWLSQYSRHQPQLFQLVLAANAEHWACVEDFKQFLSQKITEIIKAGAQTGEFQISDVGATAAVLIDCMAIVIEPSASPDPKNRLTEKRVRAVVEFLGRALR
ncbi:MAG: TetR/AcrR family transcriptional regulator [Chthoniobacterales bacterium]